MEETNVVEEDEIVGIDSARDDLINYLLNVSSTRCKTIWVVGPGGAGKTVIVNSVYQSKKVIAQFDCHAWLSVPRSQDRELSVTRSQEREQLLQSLLYQFCMGVNELHSSLRGGTAMKLENYLQGKRYIVVLDSVHREGEWASIKNMLPDYFNGSRIIVTTRNAEVAEKCVALEDHILSVTGLDWKHSWELFCLKAFRKLNRECPPDLLDLSEKIVIRCEGMPQAISAVGSLLSRKPKLQAEWIRIHDNLGSQMQDNCISTMLLPSYYDLPSNLKSCLLYFSILPEDRSIKRERLIRLWVSEGFIKKSGSKSSDEIAKDYLNELISRSLVHATSRDFNGRVKSCRVLNLNREFLLLKSREEKFATGISDSVMGSWEKIRRLSFQNASSTDLTRYTGVQLDKVRSLFVFGLDEIASSMIEQKTLQEARLLKVLDLENAPLERFPVHVLSATLLRYLSLRNTKVNIVPKNIKRLRYLECLDLRQTQVTLLPKEICSLQYLEHLLVYRWNPMPYNTFSSLHGVQIVGKIKKLPPLQKLSVIKVNRSPKFFLALGKLTRLQKLGLVDLRKEDGMLLCSSIMKMRNLSTLDLRSSSIEEYLDLNHMYVYPALLQHLYLKGRLQLLPSWITSLNSLVRLRLRWSKLSNSPVELLQHMPNLLELEMIDAFTADSLIFERGSFLKLKTLRIEQLYSLEIVAVGDGAMPMLQKLTIVRCGKLFDLPVGIEKLESLEELLLYDMPQAFTRRLAKNSEDRWKIDHIPYIHSFTIGANWSWVENLS